MNVIFDWKTRNVNRGFDHQFTTQIKSGNQFDFAIQRDVWVKVSLMLGKIVRPQFPVTNIKDKEIDAASPSYYFIKQRYKKGLGFVLFVAWNVD